MSQIRYTAVAVFDDPSHADRAIHELRAKGFDESQIGFVRRVDEKAHTHVEGKKHTSEGMARGAGLGMLIGASLGLLMAGAGVVPGAAGGFLVGLFEGGTIGGLLGALIRLGVPEDEARYYQLQLEAGHTIVTVNSDDRYEEAVAILREQGGHVGESPLSQVGPGVLP